MRTARTAILLAALMLAACAPRVFPPGPPIMEPHLTDTAFLAADGFTLPLHAWIPEEPPKAVVLAVHGFNDRARAFEDAGAFLAARGIAVYAYDQRGFGATATHGLWPGHEALVADMTALARVLKNRHGDLPLYVMGESMGGAVVMLSLTDGPRPPATGAILVAPAVWGRVTQPWYQRAALWLASHTVPWLKLPGEGLRKQATDNIEALKELSRDPLFIKATRIDSIKGIVDLMDAALAAAPRLKAPALILYGEKDQIIPRDPTFRMLRALPKAEDGQRRIALYDEGWHMLLRDLQAQTAFADIAAWLDDPGAPLPSGAGARARMALAIPPAPTP